MKESGIKPEFLNIKVLSMVKYCWNIITIKTTKYNEYQDTSKIMEQNDSKKKTLRETIYKRTMRSKICLIPVQERKKKNMNVENNESSIGH